MKQVPVQVLHPVGQKYTGIRSVWSALLAAMLLLGSLLALGATWGTAAPSFVPAAAMGLVGVLSGAAAYLLRKRFAAAGFLWVLPWPVLLAFTGFAAPWAGAKTWLNGMIGRWNLKHDGGVLLFAGSADARTTLAFTLVAALICGQLAWLTASRRKGGFAALWCVCWMAVQLVGLGSSPLACALLLAGTIGVCTAPADQPAPVGAANTTVVMTVLLVLAAVLLPQGELPQIRTLREDTQQGVWELRYGQDTLPAGDLYCADMLLQSSDDMLTVTTEQEKTLYLRAYTGGVFDRDCGWWEVLPDSAYSGDYAGLLDWLDGQGFDPFTQAAQYYALGGEAPEANTVTIQVQNANRAYWYAPATLTDTGKARTWQDSCLETSGLFGKRNYTMTEVSDARPAELTVAADWVADPQTDDQRRYAEAEAVYRSFVYDRYTTVDEDYYSLMQRAFWDDYDSESDGVYSAISRVRRVLADHAVYADDPDVAPDGEDPVEYFLSGKGSGNAVQYATVTVLALRAHGIPARYAEGYYLSAEDSAPGTVTLTGQDAHAWAEVYFDGVGWLPLDTTPGHYYEAIALQQMVAMPDAVRKTAALQENNTDAAQITGDGATQGDTGLLPEALKDTTLALLGLAALLLLALALLAAAAEIWRAVCIRRVEREYRRADPMRRAEMIEHQLFALLQAEEIDSTLGYETQAIDARVTEKFEKVKPGEFARTCALLERSVYGGQAPDAREERALSSFLWKLIRSRPKHTLLQNLKRRYRRI